MANYLANDSGALCFQKGGAGHQSIPDVNMAGAGNRQLDV